MESYNENDITPAASAGIRKTSVPGLQREPQAAKLPIRRVEDTYDTTAAPTDSATKRFQPIEDNRLRSGESEVRGLRQTLLNFTHKATPAAQSAPAAPVASSVPAATSDAAQGNGTTAGGLRSFAPGIIKHLEAQTASRQAEQPDSLDSDSEQDPGNGKDYRSNIVHLTRRQPLNPEVAVTDNQGSLPQERTARPAENTQDKEALELARAREDAFRLWEEQSSPKRRPDIDNGANNARLFAARQATLRRQAALPNYAQATDGSNASEFNHDMFNQSNPLDRINQVSNRTPINRPVQMAEAEQNNQAPMTSIPQVQQMPQVEQMPQMQQMPQAAPFPYVADNFTDGLENSEYQPVGGFYQPGSMPEDNMERMPRIPDHDKMPDLPGMMPQTDNYNSVAENLPENNQTPNIKRPDLQRNSQPNLQPDSENVTETANGKENIPPAYMKALNNDTGLMGALLTSGQDLLEIARNLFTNFPEDSCRLINQSKSMAFVPVSVLYFILSLIYGSTASKNIGWLTSMGGESVWYTLLMTVLTTVLHIALLIGIFALGNYSSYKKRPFMAVLNSVAAVLLLRSVFIPAYLIFGLFSDGLVNIFQTLCFVFIVLFTDKTLRGQGSLKFSKQADLVALIASCLVSLLPVILAILI